MEKGPYRRTYKRRRQLKRTLKIVGFGGNPDNKFARCLQLNRTGEKRLKSGLKIINFAPPHQHLTMGRCGKSARIAKAVAAIEAGRFKNYITAADFFKCDPTSVSKRIRGVTHSRKEANSLYRQCLTSIQEQVLIKQINTLTNKGMLPTSQIVKNLAEEIRGRGVGKN
jgi:hypothetical protein